MGHKPHDTYEYTPTLFISSYTSPSSNINLAQTLRNTLSILILLPRRRRKAEPFPPRTARFLLRAIMRTLGTGVYRPRARTGTGSSLVKPR